MRMRTLLLAATLALPALGQVWEPGGSQIRIQRPGPRPGLLDYAAATLGFYTARFTHSSAPAFLKADSPILATMTDSDRVLERLDPLGRVARLAPPEALDLIPQSLGYWGGVAYALGSRRHPGKDRSGAFKLTPFAPLELWVSRDFKSWQPYARVSSEDFKGWFDALLPLGPDHFLGVAGGDGNGSLSLFQRGGDGRLRWQGRVAGCPSYPVIYRSSKGITVFGRVGQYQVLDNRDAHLLHQGRLALGDESLQEVVTLARPDGNLLIIAYALGLTESPGSVWNAGSPSSQMALGLLNAKLQRQRPVTGTGVRLHWLILDPATGEQTSIPPPSGFPRELREGMRSLQFRDPGHLEW